MKIFVYSCREDETEYFEKFGKAYGVEIGYCKDVPKMKNADLAKGYECINVVTRMIDAELIEKFYSVGIRFISTRTIGYEHIDIKKAKEIGMKVANVTYSPNGVADFAIMLMLMTLRKVKYVLNRYSVQDYSFPGKQGKELKNMTVGIIGTGRIGQTVMKELSGFGCKILAYDAYENDEAKKYGEYVRLEYLLSACDVISLHIPAKASTNNIINCESISKMKNGVVIINTARGTLINTKDLIQGLEEGKVGAVGLDVIGEEDPYYNTDHEYEVLKKQEIAVLEGFQNVLITPHIAFYTDQGVSDMVENSIISCCSFMKGRKIPGEVGVDNL